MRMIYVTGRFVALVVALACAKGAAAFNPLDTNNAYDYVVLAHDSFVDSGQAQRLQTLRSTTLRSCVVRTSEVAAAFSGATLAEKVRAFVVYAYQNWKIAPTYLVLLGDANRTNPTYDLLPTMPRYNDFFSSDWSGDDYYADETYFVGPVVSGERKPIMHLGRIPARTTAQASNAIDKIVAYDSISGNPTWLQKILMTVGDLNANIDNGVYRVLNDQLRAQEFADWNPGNLQTIYSSQHPYDGDGPTVLRNAWNGGVGYVNALGNTVDYDVFVNLADFNLPPTTPPTFTESLSGTNYFPVVFGATCLVNYFHVNTESSIGEDLLLKASNRGAVAVVAESHVEDIVESYYLDRIFVHQMLHEGVRNVGRLLSTAKAQLLEGQIGHPELVNQFCLLGDPATDIKLNPLPVPTLFNCGVEIEDPPVLQGTLMGKSSGCTNDNTRIVHVDSGVTPLMSDRMLSAKLTDGGSAADYTEWKIQDLSLPMQNNMILSFWINITQSPANAGRVILDGNTTGGRIKDNADIFDQSGVRLDARSRTALPAGWNFVYADLSPLRNYTLTDLRIRYESASGSEAGDLTAYFDNLHIERYQVPGQDESEETLNLSFENDVDENGTPDFWTNVAGVMQSGNVVRSNVYAWDGQYSLAACNEYCQNGEGAQQIIFANEDVGNYSYIFYFKSAQATSFYFKVIDASNGATVVSQNMNATTSWQYAVSMFHNPGYGLAPRRLRVQFLPSDCQRPVWIDAVHIYRAQAMAAPESERPRSVAAQIIGVSPNPLPSHGQLQVRFRVPQPSEIAIEAFDAAGRRVAATSALSTGAGEHVVSWKAFATPSMAAGRYWLRLNVGGQEVPGSASVTLVR